MRFRIDCRVCEIAICARQHFPSLLDVLQNGSTLRSGKGANDTKGSYYDACCPDVARFGFLELLHHSPAVRSTPRSQEPSTLRLFQVSSRIAVVGWEQDSSGAKTLFVL